VRIRIDLDATQPPAGVASGADGAPRPFAGWLGLLQTLSDLVAGHVAGKAIAAPGGPEDPTP
jgi:hypothetical protein